MSPPLQAEVDVHFDVLCPFPYAAATWLRDVREQTGLTINWRFFSLEGVKRRAGAKHPWERDRSFRCVAAALADPTTHDNVLTDHQRVVDAGVPGGLLDQPAVRCRPAGRVARALEPYLRARDWLSINRGQIIEFAPATPPVEACPS